MASVSELDKQQIPFFICSDIQWATKPWLDGTAPRRTQFGHSPQLSSCFLCPRELRGSLTHHTHYRRVDWFSALLLSQMLRMESPASTHGYMCVCFVVVIAVVVTVVIAHFKQPSPGCCSSRIQTLLWSVQMRLDEWCPGDPPNQKHMILL